MPVYASVSSYIGPLGKWPLFCRRYFQMRFVEWKHIHFIPILLNAVSKGPIDSKSTLVQLMAWRQVITWTNDDPVIWHTYASPGWIIKSPSTFRHQAGVIELTLTLTYSATRAGIILYAASGHQQLQTWPNKNSNVSFHRYTPADHLPR